MASNDYGYPSNNAFENIPDENRNPTFDEERAFEQDYYGQTWSQSLWPTPNDQESIQEASAKPMTLMELDPQNSFYQQSQESSSLESSSWHQPQPEHFMDILQIPNASPNPQNTDEPQPLSSSETEAPMQASLQPLYPMQPQQYEPAPHYQQEPQYSMPSHPSESQTSPHFQTLTPMQPSPCYPPSSLTSNSPHASSSSGSQNSVQDQQSSYYQSQQTQFTMPSPIFQSAEPFHPRQWPHQSSQYPMPPMPFYSDSLPMRPPMDPRSRLRVIRPVPKKQGAAKTPTASRAKPYTPRTSVKQRNNKATAPPQPEVQPLQAIPHAEATAPTQPTQPQVPTTPISQQPLTNANTPKLAPLPRDKCRVISFDTTGITLPKVPQIDGTVKVVTNVPEDPTYPVVRLMSNGDTTMPVLLYDGNRIVLPTYKHDINDIRVKLDKPLPRAPTQEPVIVTFVFDKGFMTSMKVYLN
uniref:Major sperm protein n=1 Tax=Panagrellus redivivus TaxID=6233 RepID=A0A7E4V8K5_PANRE